MKLSTNLIIVSIGLGLFSQISCFTIKHGGTGGIAPFDVNLATGAKDIGGKPNPNRKEIGQATISGSSFDVVSNFQTTEIPLRVTLKHANKEAKFLIDKTVLGKITLEDLNEPHKVDIIINWEGDFPGSHKIKTTSGNVFVKAVK